MKWKSRRTQLYNCDTMFPLSRELKGPFRAGSENTLEQAHRNTLEQAQNTTLEEAQNTTLEQAQNTTLEQVQNTLEQAQNAARVHSSRF